ncbi:MAG: tetratricopeptide repeat protein [Gammaproteobacteria bacterium]
MQALLTKAREWYERGQIDKAIQLLLSSVKADPHNVEILHLLAIFYIEENNFEAASTYLEKACALKPDDLVLTLHLANVLKIQKQFPKAEALLLSLMAEQPSVPPIYNNLGALYLAQDKLADAITAFQQAINLRADYADAYYNLGLAFSKAARRQEAINTYQALLTMQPDHVGALFQLGLVLMQLHQFEQAIQYFLRLEKSHPFHFETQTNLATCYLKLAQFVPAKAHYLKANNIFPEDTQVLFNLGVLEMQQGHLREAVQYYLAAVKLDANLLDAHNNLGIAYMGLKDSPSALLHFKAALLLDPNNEVLRHTIDIIEHHQTLSTSPPAYIRALFDSYADHYDAHLVNELHYRLPKLMADKVKQFPSHDWHVLDIGCGTGLCGEYIKPLINTLVGVDLSGKMLAIAASKHIYNELIEADAVNYLAEHPSRFHLIIAGDVLVYEGDLQPLLAHAYTALLPQGYFMFNVEIGSEYDYQMTESGRFAHNKEYVERIAQQLQFVVKQVDDIVIREQNQQPVQGYFFILQR